MDEMSTTVAEVEPDWDEAIGEVSFEGEDADTELPDTETTPAGEEAEAEPAAEAQADEGEQKAEGDTPAEAQDTAETPAAPETFTLKHLDGVKTVDRDEVVVLAQKGMDYDRIRGKLEASNTESARLKHFEEFVSRMAEAGGQSPVDFMDGVEARLRSTKNGTDAAIELERVKFEREKREFEAKRQAAESEKRSADDAEAARKADVDAFVKKYPDVAMKLKDDPKAIPQSVFDAARESGKGLVAAYESYLNEQAKADLKAENERLKAELEAERQNKKNQERSTGSQATAGENKVSDPWLDDWLKNE